MPPSEQQGGKQPPPHLVRAKADGSMPRLPSRDDFGRTLDRTRATREPDGQAVQIPVARVKAFPAKRVNSRDKSRSRDAHRTVRPVEKRSPMPVRAPPLPHRYADPLWVLSVEKGKAAGRAPVYDCNRKPKDTREGFEIMKTNSKLHQTSKECHVQGVKIGVPTIPHLHAHTLAENERVRISWNI